METTNVLSIRKIAHSGIDSVDFNDLGFGKYVTDHMFSAEYKFGTWQQPEIIPFQNLIMAPTALALHYGQTVFEGMKAFRMDDGNISIFRIDKHHQRFNRSLERLCMPQLSFELFSEGIKQLVMLDSAWVPKAPGTSLYIRPFMIATEERFGVKISEEYKFIIFAGPVGVYYTKQLKVKIEDTFIRAAKGGTGYAKCGGNYGASFYPTQLANSQGFDQVIWTDGSPELNIEESGTMNIIFVMDGVVTTPPLSDSILDGITRDSFLAIALDLGYKIEERKINVRELIELHSKGKLQEVFGVGTAAVTAPIKTIHMLGKDYTLPADNPDSFSQKAKKILTDIRIGARPDKYKWNTIIC